MHELSKQDWETVRLWSPKGDLDRDLRETGATTEAGLRLFGAWLASRDRELAHLLAFCREWYCRWRDVGESDDRDRWFDEFRVGGARAALFRTSVGPRPDGAGHITDDGAAGLSRAGVETLSERYDEFAVQVQAWRDLLRDQGWDLDGGDPSGAAATADPSARTWSSLPVRLDLFSEKAVLRRTSHPTADEFVAAFHAAGLGSWFDVDKALGAAAGGTVQTFTSAMADCNIAYDSEVRCLILMVPVRTGGLAGANSSALRSLVADQARCFYLQFEDCVVLSTNGSFNRADPIGLTLLRIAAGAPRSGFGRVELPAGSAEMGQIVRRNRRGPNRDYFTVHPGTLCAEDSDVETIRTMIKAAHRHRHVERA